MLIIYYLSLLNYTDTRLPHKSTCEFAKSYLKPPMYRVHGDQTKRPETKHPEEQNILRKNVHRHTITAGDIISVGQTICRDKTSGRTKRPEGKNIRKTEHPWGQNVLRDGTSRGTKHPFGLFSIHMHIRNINNNTLLNSH
jgi:hypothetical protein